MSTHDAPSQDAPHVHRPRLRVGDDTADVRGFTNGHIQCAVDRVAFLGGGSVELTAGTFHMADALHLRSHVTVTGQGDATVLRKNAMKQARVASFMGFGHSDVIVDTPDLFELGEGVIIGDDNSGGFYETTGTLVRRDGDTWFIDRPHAHDYHRREHGHVRTLYPLVSAIDVTDAAIEHVLIDGNPAENEVLNGCRGGGFFAHRCQRVAARHVTVRDFKGEGFSFQTCDDLELAHCVAERCNGNGFHPGSGSNRFHIHHSTARRCGEQGLYYCLRVRDSLLEDCLFEHNRSHGVSIGERDTGHVNRRLTIRHNGGAGIHIRKTEPGLEAHRNIIEQCTLEHNTAAGTDADAEAEAEIVLQAATEGLRLIGNTIRPQADRLAIVIMPEVPAVELRDNRIEPAGDAAIADRRQSQPATK